jgi:hypothetical protein
MTQTAALDPLRLNIRSGIDLALNESGVLSNRERGESTPSKD